MLRAGGLVNSFRESLKFRFGKAKVIDLRLQFLWLVVYCELHYVTTLVSLHVSPLILHYYVD